MIIDRCDKADDIVWLNASTDWRQFYMEKLMYKTEYLDNSA